MSKSKWGSGDYNMTSDRNGFVYPRSEMRQEWTGKWVHKSEWEERHPQDLIKAVKDKQRVWPVRTEAEVVEVTDADILPLPSNLPSYTPW
jgi:hypothetical protein